MKKQNRVKTRFIDKLIFLKEKKQFITNIFLESSINEKKVIFRRNFLFASNKWKLFGRTGSGIIFQTRGYRWSCHLNPPERDLSGCEKVKICLKIKPQHSSLNFFYHALLTFIVTHAPTAFLKVPPWGIQGDDPAFGLLTRLVLAPLWKQHSGIRAPFFYLQLSIYVLH